jgi:hypothetical protein
MYLKLLMLGEITEIVNGSISPVNWLQPSVVLICQPPATT